MLIVGCLALVDRRGTDLMCLLRACRRCVRVLCSWQALICAVHRRARAALLVALRFATFAVLFGVSLLRLLFGMLLLQPGVQSCERDVACRGLTLLEPSCRTASGQVEHAGAVVVHLVACPLSAEGGQTLLGD